MIKKNFNFFIFFSYKIVFFDNFFIVFQYFFEFSKFYFMYLYYFNFRLMIIKHSETTSSQFLISISSKITIKKQRYTIH